MEVKLHGHEGTQGGLVVLFSNHRPLFVQFLTTSSSILYSSLFFPKYRPFTCKNCNQSFYRKNILKDHLAKCKARLKPSIQQKKEEDEGARDEADIVRIYHSSPNQCPRSDSFEEDELSE